ncbi:MAG: PP-loop domain protein [Candidatus Parvarchaeum acidophilus ARMAN-5]|uniref:PP-loop domain protein n=1 Tax=Candidatus Parvarchaeum acidophilus ARMAN-5 TaxID=662762 RepID=D6GW27_PARA5|nr:MAG: PP-loop domain protein [Candidatus Parvarchaeum acidophilus ARMAN-5]
MECEICGNDAIISTNNGTLCTEHFKKRFEDITLNTIKKYKLIKKGEKVAVANSGGKDSLSLLYILAKVF